MDESKQNAAPPPMIAVEDLAAQVQANCDISDAIHAGVFSICGLALRMRDLYKWEKRLPPWKEKAEEDILDWIGRREDVWDDVRESLYQSVEVAGTRYDAFDTAGINRDLEAYGLFYGAGYAYSLKPTFFLARITREQKVAGKCVLHLGEELARDLLTLPAMSREGVIVLRTEAAQMYLWDQIQYLKKSGKPYLQYALTQINVTENDPDALRRALPKLFEAQVETYIHHEVGEATDEVFDRETWREMIADYPHTPVELLVRAVKDLLADTSSQGTLHHLIESGQTVSLSLYAAFLDGLGRELFPEFRRAFSQYVEIGDMGPVVQAVATGYSNARHMAVDIIHLYRSDKDTKGKAWVAEE
ncbi:MAG: hypothetical protein GY703_17220, partial [Gammaproteobacteria bacterium]|nr:hypothetical protein [Gammaproteobacteria bacterium]